jgi:hypothetical protein
MLEGWRIARTDKFLTSVSGCGRPREAAGFQNRMRSENWRSPATPGLRAGVCLAAKLGLTCKQTAHEGPMRVRRLNLSRSREGLRAISRGQNRTRENRPSGIAGGSWETWQMAEIGTHAADRKGGHGHSSPSCARAQVLPDGGTATDVYMKRLVKYPWRSTEQASFPGTLPVSARAAPSTSQRGARANRLINNACRQAILPRCSEVSEVTHPYIRALIGTSCAGAREDSKGGAAPSSGRLSRAARHQCALSPPA